MVGVAVRHPGVRGSGCQSYRDRKTIHAFLAEVSPQLTSQRAALGEVEAEGNELTLLDGALTLAFRVACGERRIEDRPHRLLR